MKTGEIPGTTERNTSSPKVVATPKIEKDCKEQTVSGRMRTINESRDYLVKIRFSAGQI